MSYKIYDIKIDLKEIWKEVSIRFIWLRAKAVVGYFKLGNEHSHSITCRELPDDEYTSISNSGRFITLS